MQNKTTFIPRIEALRGVAALTVVACHVCGKLSAIPPSGWFDGVMWQVLFAISNGTGAVVTFFVLSGFVLARSLDGNRDPVRFFRNRIFRLFPAAMTVVALLTVLHWKFGISVGYEASFDPTNVILNLLLVKSDINNVMWSMTVECAATPLILMSVWLFKEQGEPALWYLIGFLAALSSWGPYAHLLGGFTTLAPLYAFVVGVLLHFQAARVAAWIDKRAANVAVIAAMVMFCFCGTRNQSALVLILECLSAAIWVVLIAQRPAMILFEPLDLGVVKFYGKISYSFYLLHPLAIDFAFRIFHPMELNSFGVPLSVTVIFATLVSILLATPLAYFMWRYVEVPFIRYGTRFGKRPALHPSCDTDVRTGPFVERRHVSGRRNLR
jgi:peptidoglycan/LPS O-acetylase OafA/YrhL